MFFAVSSIPLQLGLFKKAEPNYFYENWLTRILKSKKQKLWSNLWCKLRNFFRVSNQCQAATKRMKKVFITWNTDRTGSLLVAHHQDLELLDIVDQELLEARGQHVLGLLVATITNVGHQHLTLEPPADPVVNTSGLTPVFLQQWNKCTSINHKSSTETSSRVLTSKVQSVMLSRSLPQSSHICQIGGEWTSWFSFWQSWASWGAWGLPWWLRVAKIKLEL